MKRLLITGTRNGWDHAHLSFWLGFHLGELGEPTILVHGDAAGVDSQAAAIWSQYGMPTEAHPADWDEHGKAAGPIRNAKMVDLGADRCIAFPGPQSKGTYDCIKRAQAHHIPTFTYLLQS